MNVSTFLREFGTYLLSCFGKFFFWIGTVMMIGELVGKAWPNSRGRLSKLEPHWLFTCLALLCFLVATFQAWNEEYQKMQPELHLSVEQWGFAEGMGRSKSHLLNGTEVPAVVIATISNLGNQTIADHWKLYITVPGKKSVTAKLVDFKGSAEEFFNLGGDQIPVDDLLYKRTLNPIPRGDRLSGLLIFFVRGATYNELI